MLMTSFIFQSQLVLSLWIENIYVGVRNQVFQHSVGVPVGTNCAPCQWNVPFSRLQRRSHGGGGCERLAEDAHFYMAPDSTTNFEEVCVWSALDCFIFFSIFSITTKSTRRVVLVSRGCSLLYCTWSYPWFCRGQCLYCSLNYTNSLHCPLSPHIIFRLEYFFNDGHHPFVDDLFLLPETIGKVFQNFVEVPVRTNFARLQAYLYCLWIFRFFDFDKVIGRVWTISRGCSLLHGTWSFLYIYFKRSVRVFALLLVCNFPLDVWIRTPFVIITCHFLKNRQIR